MDNATISMGGAMTFWRAASFFDAQRITQEFEDLNLTGYTPAKSTNDANLRFALSKIFDKTGQMIRPTKTGFCVVEETKGERSERNGYDQKYSFWLEGTDHNVLQLDPYDYEVGKSVAAKFSEFCGLITGDSVTKALVSVVKKLSGTVMKPSGGIYWIPPHNLDDWAAVAHAVERWPIHGVCQIHLVRNSLDADSIRAIKDGLMEEIGEEVKKIETEVAEDELGKRALDHRVASAQLLLDKVNLYEGLLGAGLEKLKDHCSRVQRCQHGVAPCSGCGLLGGVMKREHLLIFKYCHAVDVCEKLLKAAEEFDNLLRDGFKLSSLSTQQSRLYNAINDAKEVVAKSRGEQRE